MDAIKQFEYCVTGIPSCCVSPVITWVEQPGVLISCKGSCVTVSYPEDFSQKRCITLFITCNSCGTNQIIERQVCFCGDEGGCGPCEDCGPNGVCISRCTGICDEANGTCVDCDPTHPCPGNKSCVAGGCQCSSSKPYDVGNNRCVECVGQGDCESKYGKCYKCVDGTCVYKGDCGGGVCDPATGDCEECITKGDCSSKGDNFCCNGSKKCVCCPGYVLNPNTGQCVPAPECTGNDCGPCGDCVQGKCVPRQCPDGQVCVNGDCVEKCDCNNPASCTNQGKICKNIDGQCVCVSCGTSCAAGCIGGCHCSGNNCVVDKCHGSCTDPSGCANGCGCTGGKCVDCAQLKCATGECATALGCECTALGDCVSTGNRCVGNCDTKADCGTDCTCDKGKCVPCEFFDCANGDCSKHEGCRCNGNKCEGDPDYTCKDVLEIVQIDETCDIEGRLTTQRGCACPIITTTLKVIGSVSSTGPVGTAPNKTSGTHTFSLMASLFLGNTTEAAKLISNTTNPEISVNETANAGSLILDVVTSFQPINGFTPPAITQSLKAGIASKGEVDMGSITIYQMNGYPISSGELNENRIVSSVEFRLRAEGWEFQNTCKYPNKQIGAFTVLNNQGFGATKVNGLVTTTQTRLPKFIWYKSVGGQFDASSWIRTVYVPLAASGKYVDALPNDEVNGIKYEESCFVYGLDSDCSCDTLKSKKIVFCKPTDFSAVAKPDTCGKDVLVSIGATCHANKNKEYELLVNGAVKETFKLYPSSPINNKTYHDDAGITSVTLRMKCNGGYECVNTKTFTPPTPPVIIPASTCYDQDAGKVKFSFVKGNQDPDFTGVTMKRKDNGLVLTSQVEVVAGKTVIYFIGDADVSYTYTVQFPCGSYTNPDIKKNCCSGLKPEFSIDCENGVVTVDNVQDTKVQYQLNSFGISASSLKGLANLKGDVSFTATDGSLIKITDPTTLTWKGEGCKSEDLPIPAGGDCCKFAFNPEQTGDTALMLVDPASVYPQEADATYLLGIGTGALVPYTLGDSVVIPYGSTKVTLKKKSCVETQILEVRSYDGTSSAFPCDLQDDNITVTQSNCKYVVTVPELECPCKSGVFVPTITGVTALAGELKIDFEGDFYLFEKETGSGALPLVKTGLLTVRSGNFVQTETISNIDRVSGSVNIPCDTTTSDPFSYSLSVVRTSGTDASATLKVCANWPSQVISVTGASIKNNTNSQTVAGTYLGALCWEFAGMNLTGGANLNITLTLDNGGTTVTNVFGILNPTGDEVSSTYGDDEALCSGCNYINIVVTDLELNDGCVYTNRFNTDGIGFIDHEIRVCEGEAIDNDLSNNLYPVDGAKRKIQLNYKENNIVIKTEYVNGGGDFGYLDGTLPVNPDGIEYGKAYVVEAKCACTGEEFIDSCLKPRVVTASTECVLGTYYSDGSSALTMKWSVATCYAGKTVSLYNSDGVYIDEAVTDSHGEVNDHVILLTEDMAGTGDDIVVYAQIDSGCKSLGKSVSRSEYVPTWTVDCTNSPVTYDLIFNDSPILHIVSGVGAISGYSIIDIPNNTEIVFKATLNGCRSAENSVTYDCTFVPSPSVTPSVTRSVSRSTPLYSVTPTRSITPTRSRSMDLGGFFIESVSVTRTPSITPTVTRSLTISRSINASPDSTPSVTKSITVSVSASRSLGAPDPSPSVTPSITVSPSQGASVSRSTSPIPSPSKTASPSPCNGTCPGGYTGAICGGTFSCCNGILLTSGNTCCNGVVTGPGDICCTYTSGGPILV